MLNRNGSGYYDPTAYIAMRHVMRQKEKEEKSMSKVAAVYRGDVFMVEDSGSTVGSEQRSGRPAVIVSNDIGNEKAEIVQIVYLTTRQKNQMPTHTKILARVPSTAICEQVCTVSKSRLVEYIRSCTDEEMDAINECLMISLGLETAEKGCSSDTKEIIKTRAERDVYRKLYNDLLKKAMQ